MEAGLDAAIFLDDRGVEQSVPAHASQAVFKPNDVGLYKAMAGERTWDFAVNAMTRGESDLAKASSGEWGDWQGVGAATWQYSDLTWLFLLGILGLLVLHWILIRNPSYV